MIEELKGVGFAAPKPNFGERRGIDGGLLHRVVDVRGTE